MLDILPIIRFLQANEHHTMHISWRHLMLGHVHSGPMSELVLPPRWESEQALTDERVDMLVAGAIDHKPLPVQGYTLPTLNAEFISILLRWFDSPTTSPSTYVRLGWTQFEGGNLCVCIFDSIASMRALSLDLASASVPWRGNWMRTIDFVAHHLIDEVMQSRMKKGT